MRACSAGSSAARWRAPAMPAEIAPARTDIRSAPSSIDLGQAADPRRHDRHLARHRLERREAEALLRRRQQKHVGHRQPAAPCHPARRGTPRRPAGRESATCRSAPRAIRAVADHHQPRRARARRIRGKISTTAPTRFTGRKFETWTTTRSRRRRAGARAGRLVAAPVDGAVQKIRDDADLAGDAERARSCRRAGSATPRSRRRTARSRRRRRGVRRLAAEQRDVRAVQRRQHARRGRVAFRGEDLAGEVGRGRVRHGVVRVDDVELCSRATRTIVLASASRYCGSRNSG